VAGGLVWRPAAVDLPGDALQGAVVFRVYAVQPGRICEGEGLFSTDAWLFHGWRLVVSAAARPAGFLRAFVDRSRVWDAKQKSTEQGHLPGFAKLSFVFGYGYRI
jgi:hypothetical protein